MSFKDVMLTQYYAPKDPETGITRKILKKIEPSKLAMLRSELWLKEAIRGLGKISGLQIADGYFTLVAIRCPWEKRRKQKAFYAAVTPIEIKNGTLTIQMPKLYEREQELRHTVSGMTQACIEQIRDNDFFLSIINVMLSCGAITQAAFHA